MTRSHCNRKLCLAMTGSVLALILLTLSFYGTAVLTETSALLDGVTKKDLSTLQLLHVIFRHGPRTPADTYPNDPYVNHTFHPYGWGHITNVSTFGVLHSFYAGKIE
uniref:Uncharacterized protein n=1 Tax=Glossina austeni TaxID=7395 RepID=A0A1A9UQF1_GLOAU